MKKTIVRIVVGLLAFLIVGIAGLLTYVKTALPNVGPPLNLKVEITPERIQRGKYLANSVAVCMDCHSTRDWSKFAGPLIPGTLGAGGELFNQEFGFPGAFYSKNITPYGIGNWTDGEIFRAITTGVTKDGEAIFPVMPHPNYGKLDKEDIYNIIAYLRTLPAVKNDVPKSEADFPMSFIINTIPQKATFTTRPDTSDELLYGEYLFTAAACGECHTKQEKGQKIKGLELAGGFEFKLKTGTVRSSNLTPDEETGLGGWTKMAFINRFKTYADSNYLPATIEKGSIQSVMPWLMYSSMSEKDLGAIFTYLQTVTPIKNKVERFTVSN
jgi:mono/diheme cytochrome c family protein